MRISREVASNITKGAAVAAAFSLASTPAFAQREQAAIRYEAYGAGSTSDVWQPQGALPAAFGDGDVRAQQLTVQGALRRIRGADGNILVLHGFVGRATALRLPVPDERAFPAPLPTPGVNPVQPRTLRLYALQYDFWWLNSVSDTRTIGVILRPGLFTDGTAIGLDHFRVEGAAFIDKLVSDNTTLGLGVAYGSNFGAAVPVPVLHVVHRAGSKVLIDGFLPQRLTAWYYPRKGIELGLEAQLFGAQYRLGNPAAQPGNAGQFQYANGTVGPVLRWNIGGTTFLHAEGGVTLLRRFNYAEFATGPGEAIIGYRPGNVGYLRAGMVTLF